MKQVKDGRRHDRPDNAPDDEGDLLLPGRRAKDLSGFESRRLSLDIAADAVKDVRINSVKAMIVD